MWIIAGDRPRSRGAPGCARAPKLRIIRELLLGVSYTLLLGACGMQAGEDCRIAGSGFTARDPCASKCLQYWTVHCPDGTDVQPAICAGAKGCTPGSCPAGQACYGFDDPFEEVTYCVPVAACPVAPADAAALRAWELESERAARARRQEFGKTRRAPEPLP
jgi:hypothetical protein